MYTQLRGSSILSAKMLGAGAQSLNFECLLCSRIMAGAQAKILYTGWRTMAGRTVTLRLNQQQLELIDRTVAKGEAADRVALIRRALREQAAKAKARQGAAQ